MLNVDEAIRAVLERAVPQAPFKSKLRYGSSSWILAEDVEADRDSPPFNKSLLDGYAVRSHDMTGGIKDFVVIEEVTAGHVPTRRVGPGEAVAIMTGVPLPEGADAVVMVEIAERRGDRVILTPARLPLAGDGWLPRGAEMKRGETIAHSGETLSPARCGLLASVGHALVSSRRTPFVTVLSTGDELVDHAAEPGPGQIRDSNGPMLRKLLRDDRFNEYLPDPPIPAIIPDDSACLRHAIGQGLHAHALLITGGVSAGKLDLVPAVLRDLGVEPVFHKVRLKPGKPLFFGIGPPRDSRPGDGTTQGPWPSTLVFGLPGNPVSGLVGYLLFVRPALRKMAGENVTGPLLRHGGMLAQPFSHRGDRPTYHPARWIEPEPGVAAPCRIEPLPWAGSPDLRTVASADGFAVFPEGDHDFPAGAPLAFLPL